MAGKPPYTLTIFSSDGLEPEFFWVGVIDVAIMPPGFFSTLDVERFCGCSWVRIDADNPFFWDDTTESVFWSPFVLEAVAAGNMVLTVFLSLFTECYECVVATVHGSQALKEVVVAALVIFALEVDGKDITAKEEPERILFQVRHLLDVVVNDFLPDVLPEVRSMCEAFHSGEEIVPIEVKGNHKAEELFPAGGTSWHTIRGFRWRGIYEDTSIVASGHEGSVVEEHGTRLLA